MRGVLLKYDVKPAIRLDDHESWRQGARIQILPADSLVAQANIGRVLWICVATTHRRIATFRTPVSAVRSCLA